MNTPHPSVDLHLVGGPALVSRARAAGYDAMASAQRASWLASEQAMIAREAREASGAVEKTEGLAAPVTTDRPTGSA